VEIRGIGEADCRVQILERTVPFESDPEGFHAEWALCERQLCQEIIRARQLLPEVGYDEKSLHTIAELTTSFGVGGHRADIVILKAALAHAALRLSRNGSHAVEPAITDLDILATAQLAITA
jgi:Mg-chelatase subunit ChlI